MTRDSFSPSSPDNLPRSASPNFSFNSMDEVSIDTSMEVEDEIANLSVSLHLDDESRNHIEYCTSDIAIDMSANRNDTLQRGIVLHRIPSGTNTAEMVRIGREELMR